MAVTYNVSIDDALVRNESDGKPVSYNKAEAQRMAKLHGGKIVKAEIQEEYDNRHMFRIPEDDMERLDYISARYFGSAEGNKAVTIRFLINAEYNKLKGGTKE